MRLLLLTLLLPCSVAAAQTDVIRGRIIGPDSLPVERATITATSLRGNVSRITRTDRDGRYTISFPADDGDYFVSVAALGFAAKRFEVKRLGDQDVIVGNTKLALAAQQLDAMTIAATRQRVSRLDLPPDVSGSERATNNSANGADPFGDLASLAASLPGVRLIPSADGPNGFSVLGLGADQNSVTLNGMSFGGSSLPRDANVSTTVVTTPYDVSRGNFSGGMLSIRTEPGSNFIARIGGLNVDSPALQWTDRAARSTGQQYGNVSVGGRLSAPIAFDRSSFTFAYQAGRRTSDIQSLLNTDPLGLQSAGLAADSARRLLAVLRRSRVPLTLGGIPESRSNDNASAFGTFDFMPSSTSGDAINVIFNAAWNRANPAVANPSEIPAHSGSRETWYAGIQAKYSSYLGSGFLNETSAGFTRLAADGRPYLDAPSAIVRVASDFADGTSGIQSISFGGNADLAASMRTTTAQAIDQISWFSTDNRHRFKATGELRRDNYFQDATPNRLGTFGYNSLDDLDANRPSAFMRTVGSRTRSSSQSLGAVSLGDSYRPTDALQLQYGLRIDGNDLTTRPAYNADIERTFGVRNDFVPNRVYASPRVGFSWARDQFTTVRGGIGVFQGTPTAAQIGVAMDNTGLAGAATQIVCIGNAVPSPDWSSYAAGGAAPTRCADGSTNSAFATSAPSVAYFDRGFHSPRSVRSNLQWNGVTLGNRLLASIDATYSLNLDQPSVTDMNFSATPQFTLADDGRPVFARSAAIVPATGSIGGGEARISPAFSRVAALRSDMRSEAKQLTLQLRPATFDATFSWGVSYVYSRTRERYRGFTSTAANPFDVAWSRSPFDSRHQIVYTLAYDALDVVRLNWYGSFRSGTPYTPIVASDINGDGYVNDRAFIGDDLATMKDCLRRQRGRIAERESCEGPWTATSTLTLGFNPLRLHLPQRANISFQLANPLGAADLLLHGENNLRGWGQQFAPANQLLFVRGFDPNSRRYRYDVNQRFGSTALSQNALRNPIALTAMLRVDVGPTREQQSLMEMLDRGRTLPGQRVPEPIIKAAYGTSGITNPMAQLLRASDTLGLTAAQGDSIALINRAYMMKVDSIWTPVARFLAALPERYPRGEAYARYRAAREANVDALIEVVPALRALLTPEQWRRAPQAVVPYTDTRYLASIRSGTAGASLGALMLPNGMPMPSGASNPASAVIMMHGGTP